MGEARLLIVNAGSSSLKLRRLEPDDAVSASQDLSIAGGPLDEAAVRSALARLAPFEAIGHRIVHGGSEYTHAVRIDDAVIARLEALADLAPLHQPRALALRAIVHRAHPELPEIACFDTAFHATMPPAATTVALPESWRTRWGLRRYGFHGLSHAYVSRRAGALVGDTPRPLRLVSCHLGAGGSLAAVLGGRSVDTTMGFTPLEGLVMATRSGSLDPGLILWIQQHEPVSVDQLADTLEHGSGLLGLTGSADMREVEARAATGDARAQLGLEVYLHHLRAGIAAMTAALGGIDAIVFTGGIGEHSSSVRQRAADGLRFLGVALDVAANERGEDEREITARGAAVRAFVIPAREDLEMASQMRDVLAQG